ncbi:MAG: drug/metabolite transporter (DMT)-like permease [Flavobacteriales bacterium]|jgi:drug/metabolite transporter (DMT)-like permease
MKRNILLAHVALFVVNMVYGANYLVAKGLMPHVIGPSGFIVLRVVAAGALFFVCKSFIKEKVDKKDLLRLAGCGLFGVALNQLLFFNGLNITSPINASIIMTSNPIIVLVIASILIKERITPLKISGVILGATGAIVLIAASDRGIGSGSSILGDTMCFINAISYGLYLVMVKPLMAKYKPITVISYVFMFGMIVVIPVGFSQFMDIEWVSITTSQWWSIAYVVIATTFVVYLLNIFALKHVTASVASTYIYLQPVMASLFGLLFHYFFTGFPDPGVITPLKIVCTLAIFSGVYLVSKPLKQSAP